MINSGYNMEKYKEIHLEKPNTQTSHHSAMTADGISPVTVVVPKTASPRPPMVILT